MTRIEACSIAVVLRRGCQHSRGTQKHRERRIDRVVCHDDYCCMLEYEAGASEKCEI